MSLRDPYFFPDAALFFPVVKRLAVNFVNGRFCDSHAARLSGHEEINVINCAIGGFHIHTGEIFAASKAGKLVVVDPDQIKREIFALIVDVKLLIPGLLTRARDMPFDAGRNIDFADLLCRCALRGRCCYLW